MDEQPFDYVAAAIVYLMYEDDGPRSDQTVEGITSIINDRFEVAIPDVAVFHALTILYNQSLVQIITSRYATQYYSAMPAFKDKIASWRAERADPAAIVYNNFMNGPAHWMQEAMQSPRFLQDLAEQLTPVDDVVSTTDTKPSRRARANFDAVDIAKVSQALGEAIEDLESLDVGNENKAQAHALLTASKSLADAPEPPLAQIWDLIQRANNVAGIASLMVALIALFTSH